MSNKVKYTIHDRMSDESDASDDGDQIDRVIALKRRYLDLVKSGNPQVDEV